MIKNSIENLSNNNPKNHQLNVHYTGKKYVELPAVVSEGVGPGLASALVMQNNLDNKATWTKGNTGGLEEIIMSLDLNLDNIM